MSTSDKSAELENARRLHAESERLVSSLDSLRSHLLAVEQIAEQTAKTMRAWSSVVRLATVGGNHEIRLVVVPSNKTSL